MDLLKLFRRDKAPAFNDPTIWTTIANLGFGRQADVAEMADDLQDGMKHWNYVCLSLISKHIGATRWFITKGTDDDQKEIFEHPALDLLAFPNPNTNRREFMERSVLHLDLTGNCFWYIDRNLGKQVRRAWILRPDLVTVNVGEDGIINNYEYKPAPNKSIIYPLDSIIHIRHAGPYDEYYGISPMSSLRETFDLDANVRIFLNAFFGNMARPDILISVKSAMNELQRKRFADNWNQVFRGPEKAGKPAVLEGDATVTPLAYSNSEQQFKELSDWVRRCILNAYAIPEAMFDPSSNRATAFQADTTFNRECIIPRLEKFREGLDRLALNFDKGIAFAYENPVPKDREFDINRNIQYVNAGILTPNEVRIEEGYEPIEGGDELSGSAPPAFFAAESTAVQKVQPPDALASKWYAYVDKHKRREGPLRAAVSRAFDWDRREIKARLRSDKGVTKASNDPFPSMPEWIAAWKKLIGKDAWIAYEEFARATARGLGLDWDLDDPRVRAHFDKILDRGMADVLTTTRQKVSDIIAEQIEANASPDDIAKAIDTLIDGWQAGKSRAWTIARTETTKLSNAAIMDAGAEAEAETGQKVVKVWIAAVDERTRDSHLRVNGEEVALGQAFSNGLEYPGEGDDPAEVVNCRCTSEVQFAED